MSGSPMDEKSKDTVGRFTMKVDSNGQYYEGVSFSPPPVEKVVLSQKDLDWYNAPDYESDGVTVKPAPVMAAEFPDPVVSQETMDWLNGTVQKKKAVPAVPQWVRSSGERLVRR